MRRKLFAFILVLFYLVTFAAYTADIEPKLQELYSPRLFGPAATTTVLGPPQSSVQNPASAGLAQRMTFDGNYTAIIGQDESSSTEWSGHVLNFGHTTPTKVGVFTWNTSLLQSTFSSLNTGSRLSVHGSFAKDIYPDTLVGIGIGTSMAEGPEFGIDTDLGLIRLRSTLWFLEDVRWSVVLNNFGYSGIEGVREPLYSVTGGIDGRFLDTEKVDGRFMSEIKVPEFSNFIWSTGMKFQIGYGFEASLGTRVNAEALLNGEMGELIPSVTLGYTFSPGSSNAEKTTEDLSAAERFTQNELQPYASAAPISSEMWAFGIGLTVPIGLIDTEPPEIQIDLSGVTTQYSEEPEETPQAEQNSDNEDDAELSSDKVSALSEKSATRAVAGKGSKHPTLGKSVVYIADKPEDEKDLPAKDNEDAGAPASDAEVELTEELIKNEIPDAEIYLSPNNDGIQDSLSFPLSIGESRYIKGYEFVVENSQGEAVRTIENKETRPEKRTVKTFFQNLFKSKSGIQVPDTLRWDGTTDTGETAPDGLYYFYLRAWDDNGNYGTSDTYTVYVDTQPPVVRIEKQEQIDRIFSPNDDGQKDALPIIQNGSREDLWRGEIKDSSGNIVKTKNWRDTPPQAFEWDGTNNEEILVSDGVYEYFITSTDKAGNSGKAEYGNLVKNTEETPISLSIDHSHFSPNGDGILDVVLLQPKVPVQQGLESWTIKIVDKNGREYRSFSGTGGLSGVIPFDGKVEDGDVLPENREYFADLQVLYVNGNRPTTRSAPFVVDITPPKARVEIDNRVFSPNGDGNKDTIKFHQDASKEENWYGTITDIDENPVYQYKWIEQPEQTITWDGRKEDGSLAEDGYYFYQLSTVDRAGNRGESRKMRYELNTEETPVLFTANYDYFSPNGDGSKDTIKFFPKLEVEEGIEKYTLEVVDKDNEIIFSRSGTGTLPESMLWDGFSSAGDRVEGGRYRAKMEVLYANGNNPTAETQLFTVDTVFPSITVEPEYTIFSPEGDGNRDTITFAQDSSSEQLWEAEVLSSDGAVVSSASWKGTVEDYIWDGTDKAGNSVDDGFYSYRIFSTDRAGNTTEERIANIKIDTAPTQLFVTAGSDKLAPTGNGIYEEISFSTIVNRREGLEDWSLELVDSRGTVQKEFSGEERIPEQIVWDGKNVNGEYVEGSYKARFSARYTKGNRPSVESLPFVLDVTPPQADVNLEPTPFSPDNDGLEDELSIMLRVSDRTAIQNWRFTIYDAERAGVTSQDGPVFKQYSGRGEPAEEIIWDGRSDDGELVYAAMDYPYRFEVSDALGNRTIENGKIPVDVLVVREGDVLKIKIASINFKPNSAEFVDDKPEIAARNQYVLDRLAEILEKYRQYEITIEGHANITKFWDPELARQEQINELIPLSEERAKRVLEALTERGISRSRLSAEGVGGSKPIVDFQDEDNRWKNRRVEFILEKD